MEFSIVIITLLLSAFFSGMEIAFISSNRLKLELDKSTGSFVSKTISIFSKYESFAIATLLIGNNIALVIFSISMTDLMMPFLEFINSDILELLVQTIITTIIILIMSFHSSFILRIELALLFSIPLLFFYFILYPIVLVLIFISEFFLNIFLD